MKKTLFMTGFPGFLATDLIKQLLYDYKDDVAHIYVLVLAQEKKDAAEKMVTLAEEMDVEIDLFSVRVGDITQDKLGLDKTLVDVTHVFHLAAIYDLAVPERLAEIVHIHGTECVNEWVRTLPNLERYIYFSTAYVSGKREGRIYEQELIAGQLFRNHYERTKYEAEIQVQQMKQIVPTTIIRPAVVKGHSKTGVTMKFDGLYFMLNFYDALRHSPIIPYLKAGPPPEGNFIPSDYVLKAAAFLSMNPVGEGKTYHLTDPNPVNMMEVQKLLAEHFLGRTPRGILSIKAAKQALKHSKIRQWLGVEIEALDYFIYQSSYDVTQSITDLAGTGICCPNIEDTIPSMVSFYRKYKDDHTKHIKVYERKV